MKINPLREIILGLALLFAVLVWLVPRRPSTVQAQYQGSFSQQTDVETFYLTWNSSPTVFNIKNLGQAGHSLVVEPNAGGGPGCSIWLQGSGDNTYWVTLAALPNPTSTEPPIQIVAAGQMPYFRIIANPNNTTTCKSSANPPPVTNLYYTGYQFAPPAVNASETFRVVTASPQSVYPDATDYAPYQVLGVECYNGNSSAAFLQFFDASSTPTLGSGQFWESGIAATQHADFQLNNFSFKQHLYLGAATAAGGSTAVSTALICNVQVNRRGPFGSFAGN